MLTWANYMKELFLLEQDLIEQESFCQSYDLPEELDDNVVTTTKLETTESIKEYKQKDLIFTFRNNIIGDHLFVIGNYNIISQKFADLLTKYVSEKIELIPVTLRCKGKKNLDYFLLNPLEKRSPIDYEKSELKQLSTGKIRRVTNLSIKEDSFSEIDMFRFEEFKTRLIVSAELKEEIEKEKLTGVSFRPLKDFQFPYKH